MEFIKWWMDKQNKETPFACATLAMLGLIVFVVLPSSLLAEAIWQHGAMKCCLVWYILLCVYLFLLTCAGIYSEYQKYKDEHK